VLAKRARLPSASRYSKERLIGKGIRHQLEKRFGQSVLPFTDQDGMALALFGIADAENEPGRSIEDIPSKHAIRGLQGVTLLLDGAQKTAAILTGVFGFREVAREGSVVGFAAAGDVKGSVVDIHETAGVLQGTTDAAGASHRPPRRDRRTAGGDDREADPYGRPIPDRTKGPQVLPLDLLS
jgi:glyoxalase family protein